MIESDETRQHERGRCRTARLFRDGRNQAVRLPRELEFDAQEVYIRQEGKNLILKPKQRSWRSYFESARRLSADYPDQVEELPPQQRESL